jgi:hypothetical protein
MSSKGHIEMLSYRKDVFFNASMNKKAFADVCNAMVSL